MKRQFGYTATELLIGGVGFPLILAAIFGWGWNVVKIATSDFELTGILIARVIGVFVPPVGSIIGYF